MTRSIPTSAFLVLMLSLLTFIAPANVFAWDSTGDFSDSTSFADGCKVTCGEGYYACCYETVYDPTPQEPKEPRPRPRRLESSAAGDAAFCKCIKNGEQPPQPCNSGGEGTISCEISNGAAVTAPEDEELQWLLEELSGL